MLSIATAGTVTQRILLTEAELRACADACLAGIGWTPYVRTPEVPDAP